METSEPGTQPQTWIGTEYILFNECLVFPLRFLHRHTVRQNHFHLWLSFFLLTVWSFPMSWYEALLPVPQNKTPWWPAHTGDCTLDSVKHTGKQDRDLQFLSVPEAFDPSTGVPHLASLISPDGFAGTHCMFSLSPDSRISSSLVVTVVGWRGRDTRSPATISHYFNIESFGHTAQCPQAGGSVGASTPGPRLSDFEYS